MDYPLLWLISWSEAKLLSQVSRANDSTNARLLACTLLPILPMISLVLSAGQYIIKGNRSRQLARIDGLHAAKTVRLESQNDSNFRTSVNYIFQVTAVCVAMLEIYKHRLQQMISPAVLAVYAHPWMNNSLPLLSGFASACLVAVVPLEHIYATQSSARVTIFLLTSAITDATQAVMAVPSIYHHSPNVFFTSLALKACLLILQEMPKSFTQQEIDRKALGIEERAGFLSRTFGLWIHSTLFLGFKRTIRMEDLTVFGSSFSSKVLLHRFQKHWSRSNKGSVWHLAFALSSVVIQPLMLASVYEIALAICQYSLPALVQLTIEKLQPDKNVIISKHQLVLLTFLAHMAVCLTRSISRHIVNRVCTILSSTLTSALLEKDTLLGTLENQDMNSMAFVADVTGIVDIVRSLAQLSLSIYGPIVGVYILWKPMGSAVAVSLAWRLLWGLISCLLQPSADAAAIIFGTSQRTLESRT